jgi:hypothetical protein
MQPSITRPTSHNMLRSNGIKQFVKRTNVFAGGVLEIKRAFSVKVIVSSWKSASPWCKHQAAVTTCPNQTALRNDVIGTFRCCAPRLENNLKEKVFRAMEQRAFKNVNNCLNTNIYSYLETSGGQTSNLYLNVVHFFQHQC